MPDYADYADYTDYAKMDAGLRRLAQGLVWSGLVWSSPGRTEHIAVTYSRYIYIAVTSLSSRYNFIYA